MCSACDMGYRLVNDLCVANVCTCDNGTPATGTNCLEDGEPHCETCDSGWFINEANQCVDSISCSCPNGTAATGTVANCAPVWWPTTPALKGYLTAQEEDTLDSWLRSGKLTDDYQKAIDFLQQLIDQDSRNEVAILLMAATNYLQGDKAAAEGWLVDIDQLGLAPTLTDLSIDGQLLNDLVDYLDCSEGGDPSQVASPCETNLQVNCVACDLGFHLSNEACVENQCVCANGTPATGGPNCPIDGEVGCDACDLPLSGIANFTGVACDEDIDECDEETDNCSELCANTIGSFQCSCPAGYELLSDGTSCRDINECSVGNGGCEHNCSNTLGGYECLCPEGFTPDPQDTKKCIEIDECEGVDCNNGRCKDLKNDYVCVCDPGWEGALCDANIDDCVGQPCNNGGTVWTG